MSVSELSSVTDFEAALAEAPGLVVVDFWAVWCGPCQFIAPVMLQLAARHPDLTVLKVDVDEAPELVAKYGIRAVPTVLFFQNGTPVERLSGAAQLDAYEAIITKLTKSE